MITIFRSYLVVGSVCVFFSLISCSEKRDSSSHEPVTASGGSGKAPEKERSAEPTVSGDRKLFVNSMSNNSLTSHTVNRAKAAEIASSLGSDKTKDPNSLYGAIAAHRLAGHTPGEALAKARALVDIELSKNIEKDLPEPAQLEIALSALQSGKLAFAEFYLDKLIRSKSPEIKAAAINALGVVALRMDRIPEAMVIFKESLAARNDYKPALLNIGFLALRGGDVATAKRALGGMQDDWYVESAFIPVLRVEGDSEKADGLCSKVLAAHPKHKPTLINCGINAYQGKADYKKARDYLNRALSVQGGSPIWDEKSGRLLGVVDAEEARASQVKANKEAEERKAKAEAAKQKPNPEQPKPSAPDAAAPKQQ